MTARSEAHDRLRAAILRRLSADYNSADDPHFGDEVTYSDELIELAARELTTIVEASDYKPVGWVAS